MKLRVVYSTQLRAALDIRSEEVEIPSPVTLVQLLDHLGNQHGQPFQELVRDDGGSLLPSIILCIDNVQADEHCADELPDGCEVTILSAISGG